MHSYGVNRGKEWEKDFAESLNQSGNNYAL